MTDIFSNRADQVAAPATRAGAVTPHDSNALPALPKALYVGIGGTIVLAGADGVNASFANIANGTVLPVRAAYVRATGTTASAIVALY